MADLTPDLQVCLSWGLIAESFHSLQSLSVSYFHVILGLQGPCFPSIWMWKAVLIAPLERSTCPYQRSPRMRFRSSIPSCSSSSLDLAHTFHQPVCQRFSWLHHWSIPHVHTIRVFSSSEWGADPQCKATQVAHWTWWWQCLGAWHCRSVWSLPCHSAADAGVLALSIAKSHWHGALHSAHKSCIHSHGLEREMTWRKDWWQLFELLPGGFLMLWLEVHSHLLLRAKASEKI